MENIPVQRKQSGMPAWGWVLIVLAVIGVAIWILSTMDWGNRPAGTPGADSGEARQQDASGQAGQAESMEAGTGAGTGVITGLDAVFAAQDRLALAGRPVELKNVKVKRVLGDRIFAVGADGNQELLAVLAKDLDLGRAEPRIVITPGLVLELSGVLERPPQDAAAAEQSLGLRPEGLGMLRDQPAYLRVTKIGGMK